MSTINYTYNVIVDRFRQFAAGHFQLRRFTHGEISQADLEKEAEWPWMHVKPRAINYSPGTRAFSFEVFISDLPRDKEDKTGYQAESITDCSLIFQDLINEIHLGHMFGDDVLLTRPVNSEPFVEQYTHTLTGVTGTIELNLDYDWSACSIPASWNYNTPTDSPSDGWGALQFIESLDQNGVFVSLLNDEEAPGNSYYYGTDAAGIKGWYAIVDNIGLTCETLPDCAVIIGIVDDIIALQTDVALKANTADLGATAFSNSYNDLDNLPTIPAAQVNSDWNAVSGVSEILNKPTIPSIAGLVPDTRTISTTAPITGGGDLTANRTLSIPQATTLVDGYLSATDWTTFNAKQNALGFTPVPSTRTLTINGTTQDLSADRTFTIATGLMVGTTPITSGTVGRVLFEGTGNVLQQSANLFWDNTNGRLGIGTASPTGRLQILGSGTTSATNSLVVQNSSATNSLVITDDGKVTIGRTAGAYVEVGTLSNFYNTSVGYNHVFRIGGSEVARIASTGNVLINTTTDAGYKLDVNGTGRINTLTIGLGGGQVSTNMSFGVASMTATATGGNNTAIGFEAGQSITSGNSNVAIGFQALRFNNTGASNVVIGRSAGNAITSGTQNTAIGTETLISNTTSNNNTAIGSQSLMNVTGAANTAIGVWSGRHIADGSTANTTGSNSVFLGQQTKALANGQTNQIVIGFDAIGLGSNSVVLGNSSVALTALRGNVLINTTTDAGFKLDVNGTARVKGLGTTTAITFSVQNSSSTNLLTVTDAGSFATTTSNFSSVVTNNSNSFQVTGSIAAIRVGSSITIASSSILQADSTTQGFLPPRMTTTQKNAIASPAAGLVVYDTTLGKLCVRGAAAWETITSL
jgi:hypothetical protein